MRSDSCSALACLYDDVSPALACTASREVAYWSTTYRCSSSLASRPIISRSRLVLRGLIDRTSFGANRVSTGPESEESLESRGTMIVPLLFLLWNLGRTGTGALMSRSSSEDPEEESDLIGGSGLVKVSSLLMARSFNDSICGGRKSEDIYA